MSQFLIITTIRSPTVDSERDLVPLVLLILEGVVRVQPPQRETSALLLFHEPLLLFHEPVLLFHELIRLLLLQTLTPRWRR